MLAWLLFAVVNAALVDALVPIPKTHRVRVLHHLFGLGQALGAGAIFGVLWMAWERSAPRRSVLAWAIAFSAVIFPVGVFLKRDLVGLAAALPGRAFWEIALGPLLATSLLGALLAGKLAARFGVRLVAVGVAALAFAANSLFLRSGYYALHLDLAGAGALLAGTALVGAKVPRWLVGAATRLAFLTRWPGLLVLLVPGLAAFVAARDDVTVEMLRVRGEAFTPYLARFHHRLHPNKEWPPRDGTWFASRHGAPPVAPSQPPLVTGAPIVVLVTVDALRADVVNDDRFATRFPAIRALRERSVNFVNARSTAPQTAPSLTSIMTGRTYSMMHWTSRRSGGRMDVWPIEEAAVRFPQLLSNAGVANADVTGGSGFASPSLGVLRGFHERINVDPWHAKDLVDHLIRRIKTAGSSPLFLYTHVMEPHYPYDPPGPTPFDRYLGEVATVDAELARLVAALDEPDVRSRAILILSADHGEAFGDHGAEQHSVNIYDELIHVPLLVHAPDVAPHVVERAVSLLDLGPTILDVFGQKTPASFMGQSLVPYLRGEDARLDRPIVADSGRRQQAMVFDDGYKVIVDLRHGTTELYDLAHDPKELDNLADARSDVARAHAAVLGAYFARHTLSEPGYQVPYRQ